MDVQKHIDEVQRKVNDLCNPATMYTAQDVARYRQELDLYRKKVINCYDEKMKTIPAQADSLQKQRNDKLSYWEMVKRIVPICACIVLLICGLVLFTVIEGKFEVYFFGAMLWPEIICFFLLKWGLGHFIDDYTPPGTAIIDKQMSELYKKRDLYIKQQQDANVLFDNLKKRLDAEERRRWDLECRAENERRQALLILQKQQEAEEARRKAEEARQKAEEARRKEEEARRKEEEARRREAEARRRAWEEEQRKLRAEEEARARQLAADVQVFNDQVAVCTEQMLEASERSGALKDMINQLTDEVKRAMHMGGEKTQAQWWLIFSVVIKDTALEYHIMTPNQKEKPKFKAVPYERITSEYKKYGLCEGLITLMKFNPLVGEDAEWTADVHDVCGADALHKQRTVNNKGFTTTAVTSFKITYTGPNINYEKPQSLY